MMPAEQLWNEAAEEEVLGACISFPGFVSGPHMDEDLFFAPRNRETFRAIHEIACDGHLTPQAVAGRLADEGMAQAHVWVAHLLGCVSVRSVADTLVDLLGQYRFRRDFQKAVVQDPKTPEQAKEVLSRVSELAERLTFRDRERPVVSATDGLGDEIRMIDEVRRYIPSGLAPLDDRIGGWSEHQLVLVAGRPGTGKSSLMLGFGEVAAAQGYRVLFFTLEMSVTELRHRLLSFESGVPLWMFRQPERLMEPEWTKIHQAAASLKPKLEGRLILCDRAPVTVNSMLDEVRHVESKVGDVDLVIVDYLQLVSGSNPRAPLYERVSEVSRQLKMLAKELGIPVISGAQLNRQLEQRSNKMPLLSDLRDSGALEQDADVVMFTHRAAALGDLTADPSRAELIVAKNRQGPLMHVDLHFKPDTTQFSVDFHRLMQ